MCWYMAEKLCTQDPYSKSPRTTAILSCTKLYSIPGSPPCADRVRTITREINFIILQSTT